MVNYLKKVALILTILPLLLFIFGVGNVQACSCAESPPVETELQRSSAVFSGNVIKISDSKNGFIVSSADPLYVTVEVNKVWKGQIEERVVVQTARDGASCGFGFELGREYIVYAQENNGTLSTGLCDRTNLLSMASEDLTKLGEGQKPLKQSTDEMTGPSYLSMAKWLIVGLLILALVIKIVYRKRS
jgi:hypothetical protein